MKVHFEIDCRTREYPHDPCSGVATGCLQDCRYSRDYGFAQQNWERTRSPSLVTCGGCRRSRAWKKEDEVIRRTLRKLKERQERAETEWAASRDV